MPSEQTKCPKCGADCFVMDAGKPYAYECMSRWMDSGRFRQSDDCTIRALTAQRDEYRDGYQRTEFDARACPGCDYREGVFHGYCHLHQTIADLTAEVAGLRERAERAERENAVYRNALEIYADLNNWECAVGHDCDEVGDLNLCDLRIWTFDDYKGYHVAEDALDGTASYLQPEPNATPPEPPR